MTTTTPTPLDFGLPPAEATMLKPFSRTASIYPRRGDSGITHFTRLESVGPRVTTLVNNTLLRDSRGVLVAWVRHYPIGLQLDMFSKDKDEFSIYVDPRVWRRGHGATILRAAHEHWHLNFWSQHYTAEGRALVLSFLNQEFSSLPDVNLSGECATNPRATQLNSFATFQPEKEMC